MFYTISDEGGGDGYFHETIPATYLNLTTHGDSLDEIASRQKRQGNVYSELF